MGLVCSQLRLLMLYDRKSRLEFQMQALSTRIMAASAQTSGLATKQAQLLNTLSGNYSDEQKEKVDLALQKLEYQIKAINDWSTLIEQQQKQIDTQHNIVQTEIECVKKTLDKDVEHTKYFQHG